MDTTPRKIIRLKEVQKIYPKSRVQIWRDVRAGLFPAPTELGPNSIGWFEDEVIEVCEARPRRTYGAKSPYKPQEEAVQ